MKSIPLKIILLLCVLAIVIIGMITVMSLYLPPAVDWYGAIRLAALEILKDQSPYNADSFFYPPWTANLLIPFAGLPENIGRAIMALTSLSVYSVVAYLFGAKKNTKKFLLLSPPALHSIFHGNIDWLGVLVYILPSWNGLFFLSLKPQTHRDGIDGFGFNEEISDIQLRQK